MKLNEEIAFILFYIAGFGISEYFVQILNLNGIHFLLYHLCLLLIGIILNIY